MVQNSKLKTHIARNLKMLRGRILTIKNSRSSGKIINNKKSLKNLSRTSPSRKCIRQWECLHSQEVHVQVDAVENSMVGNHADQATAAGHKGTAEQNHGTGQQLAQRTKANEQVGRPPVGQPPPVHGNEAVLVL
jgi:hypothetical protein